MFMRMLRGICRVPKDVALLHGGGQCCPPPAVFGTFRQDSGQGGIRLSARGENGHFIKERLHEDRNSQCTMAGD